MGNKVTIGLDVQRELKYDINAVVALERRFDKPLPQIFAKDVIGFETIVAMVTIALKAGGMKLTGTNEEQEEYVGNVVQQHWLDQGRTWEELMQFVMKAMQESNMFPKTGEDATPNPAQGTGD